MTEILPLDPEMAEVRVCVPLLTQISRENAENLDQVAVFSFTSAFQSLLAQRLTSHTDRDNSTDTKTAIPDSKGAPAYTTGRYAPDSNPLFADTKP